MNDMNEKIIWMRSLKVGDIVCDCRYKHLAIKEIKDDVCPARPQWLLNIIYWEYWPTFLDRTLYYLDDIIEKLYIKFGWVEVYDKALFLEDGGGCSAMNCCDRVPHSWHHDDE
jgi:hypothetical protein